MNLNLFSCHTLGFTITFLAVAVTKSTKNFIFHLDSSIKILNRCHFETVKG